MRIVVTGATGNVGSALLRRLTRSAAHEVVGIARRLPSDAGPPFDEVTWVAADLTDEASTATLTEAFARADAVVHLAWGFQPSHDLKYLEALGVGGTQRVIEAVAATGVAHLVHMSSVGAYSPKKNDVPVDESWPTGGIPSSPYSRHKSAAERLLDDYERSQPHTVVTRMRPGIVGQGSAGSSLLRYGFPLALPPKVLDLIPVVPLDRRLAIPMVHADDVADAFVRVLDAKVPGAFNLAAEPPITPQEIAAVLGARAVHVPAAAVRALVALSWRLHVQQVDAGWLDLGYSVPLLDTARARTELGWSPTTDAVSVLQEVIAGMRETSADETPALRRRTVADQLRQLLRRGPVSRRQRP